MCEHAVRLGVVVVMVVLVVVGCASPMVISPPPPSAGDRPPAVEAPSNFASPTDLFQRYPTMRNQRL